MCILNRSVAAASLFAALLFTPFEAQAQKFKIVSGLSGAQDSKSRELTALTSDEANQKATQDLLSVLKPTGNFTLDNSRNVEGMMFTTEPYQTNYRYVCRQDRVTLRYQKADRFDAAGTWLNNQRQPVGIEAQPSYHIEQLPVPGFAPGTSFKTTICDGHHPGAAATWFAAPSDTDAVRAANMFRMAVDDVKVGRLTPGPCNGDGADACRKLILSMDDPSKIKSVEPCAPSTGDSACYVISFHDIDITVTGTIPNNSSYPITPTAIMSIRADTVITMSL
jgi:hypothetical protein